MGIKGEFLDFNPKINPQKDAGTGVILWGCNDVQLSVVGCIRRDFFKFKPPKIIFQKS